MLPELAPRLTLRDLRLEVRYTAARLAALDETRTLAQDFEEAAEKLSILEEEDARLSLAWLEARARVEAADDAWDDTVRAFQRRLLDRSGNDCDHPLYRRYFAELPSEVTELSYPAEILISKDLEVDLLSEAVDELSAFSPRLADKRAGLEAALYERTRLEVETAKFHNRVSLARTLVDKLRRMLFVQLEDLAARRDRPASWPSRFFMGGGGSAIEGAELKSGLPSRVDNGEAASVPSIIG